jgi:hypothetical protein
MIHAVTPDPHMVTMGFSKSTLWVLKTSSNSCLAKYVPSLFSNFPNGILIAPGACPEGIGRGSGSEPAKRPAERASINVNSFLEYKQIE